MGVGEGEEGGGMVDLDPLSESYGAEENLPPLEKLERYFQSEDVLDRCVWVWVGVCVGVGVSVCVGVTLLVLRS